jgi:localization factor PodJL
MKKAGPWNIDGIKPDIRETAREAARRQGLSLGAWLNNVIIEQALELGIDAREMDSNARLEAVAARLHQLDDEDDVPIAPARMRSNRAMRDDRWPERPHDRFRTNLQEPIQDRTRNRMQDRIGGQDAEALLDAAVDAFEHSIAKNQRRTAQSFEAVDRRLADIESHLTRHPEDTVKPIKSALARLEARLDTFPAPPRDDTSLKRLEGKLDALLRGSALSTQRPLAKSAWRNSLESAVAEISEKQRLLNGGLRAQAPGRAPSHSADLRLLQRDIAGLGVKLEEMRLQDLAKDLTRMRDDIGTMSAGMADLAPRDSVTAIEAAIRNLTTRIESSHENGMRETLLKPITELVDGLRHSLNTTNPHPSIDGLGRELKTISNRLDALAAPPHEPSVLAHVQAQIQDIHGLLTAGAPHPLSFEDIEQKVAALAEQVNRQSLEQMPPDGEAQSARPRQMPVDSLAKIEDQLDDLAQKIEKAVAARGAASAKVDGESLEAIVRALADKFTTAQEPRAGQAAFELMQNQVSQLTQRLEQADSGFSTLSALQQTVSELFAHLDETRSMAQEAARNAAHEALREVVEHPELIQGNAASEPAITREIADLRAVQDEAGRRTHSTLNAVHATLEKIVDRLAMLEEEMGEAKDVSTHEQQPSEQNALFARYRDSEPTSPGGDKLNVRPSLSHSADFLIEPGTLFPNGNGLPSGTGTSDGGRAADSPSDPARSRSDFIAAARRAAQAAQTEHEMARPRIPIGGLKDTRATKGLMTQARDFLTNHRRQLSLSVAALFLVIGAYAVVRTLQHSNMDVSLNTIASAVRSLAGTSPNPGAEAHISANDIALNVPQHQTPRDVTPAQIAEPPNRVPEQALTQSASPGSLPLMAAGGGMTKPPEKPIAGSDPIITGAITAAPRNAIAPVPETAAAALALREQAEGGNAAAQYELATRYAEGRLMPRDFKLAADWYEKAAVRGLAPAQYRLGSLYEKGIGVTRDLTRAKEWYEKAANQGHSHAMHNLAVLIAEGSDGKPDYATASIWFRKAAELGVRDSQYNLAILFARGLGVQQDLVQSYKWFALAAAQGDEDAGKKREDVAAKLDANALAQAKAAVDAFQPREADHAANDVQVPPGGWEAAVPAPAQSVSKAVKPKMSRL